MMDISQESKDTSADSHLRALICVDIYTAVESNLYTTSAITWTSVSEEDMLKIVKELLQQGFNVALGTGTLTISWQ
jgi:hypothetical protein